MFVKFFSGHVYPLQWWPAVFQIENMIQATVREDWREMAGKAGDELIATLRDRLEQLDATEPGRFPTLDESFITAFLGREAPSIATLLADLQVNIGQNEISVLDPRFALNEQCLRECMDASEEFRRFIQK